MNCGLLLGLHSFLHVLDLMHTTMIRMTRHVRTKISTTRPTDTPTAIGTMESGGVTNGDMLGVVGLASIVVELVVVEVVGLKRTK